MNCKYCGSIKRTYRNQIDNEGNTFHVIECIKGCHRVVSYQSITNARNQWKTINKVVRQDLYDNIIFILSKYYNNKALEKVIRAVNNYQNKSFN